MRTRHAYASHASGDDACDGHRYTIIYITDTNHPRYNYKHKDTNHLRFTETRNSLLDTQTHRHAQLLCTWDVLNPWMVAKEKANPTAPPGREGYRGHGGQAARENAVQAGGKRGGHQIAATRDDEVDNPICDRCTRRVTAVMPQYQRSNYPHSGKSCYSLPLQQYACTG